MSRSKNRPRWAQLPVTVRAHVEQLVGARVVDATSCSGGFSPGFASRLALVDGRRVFVKALDTTAWPDEAPIYRAEAAVAAVLPTGVLAPPLLGASDDGQWIVLAFEHIDGAEPAQPWRHEDLRRVLDMLDAAAAIAASPSLAADHPRLGGFDQIAADPVRLAALRHEALWAADDIDGLVALESAGLAAARGTSLVHFDAYPHNVLMTPTRAMLVDWPHARAGAPIVDVVTMLSSVAMHGGDPEPVARSRGYDPMPTTAVLAAQAGFCLAGGLGPAPPGLEPIVDTKRMIGLAALAWLRRRT